MSRLTRDGTAEPVSRDQILRHVRGQGNVHFPCSADHEQDWQPYPVDPHSAVCRDGHTSIHTIHDGRGECDFRVVDTAISCWVYPEVPPNRYGHILSKLEISHQAPTVDWWLS